MNFNDALKLTTLSDPQAPCAQATSNQKAKKESAFIKWKREHGIMTDWSTRGRMWCAIRDGKKFHNEDIKVAVHALADHFKIPRHEFQA